jgi:hypothetical protein
MLLMVSILQAGGTRVTLTDRLHVDMLGKRLEKADDVDGWRKGQGYDGYLYLASTQDRVHINPKRGVSSRAVRQSQQAFVGVQSKTRQARAIINEVA